MKIFQKGFGLLGLLVIVAVVGVGAWLMMGGVDKNADTIINNPPVSVDTSNWKTYRSNKYKFEFKYPNDWDLSPDSTEGDPHIYSDLQPEGDRMTLGSTAIEFMANIEKPIGDLLAYVKEITKPEYYDLDFGSPGDVAEVILGGRKFYKVDHNMGEGPDGPGYYVEVDPTHFGYFYVYGRNHLQIAEQILASLKLTK